MATFVNSPSGKAFKNLFFLFPNSLSLPSKKCKAMFSPAGNDSFKIFNPEIFEMYFTLSSFNFFCNSFTSLPDNCLA